MQVFPRRRRSELAAFAVAFAIGATAGLQARAGAGEPRPPRLEFHVPSPLSSQAERFARFDTGRLTAVMRLVGLDDPGPAIPVFLVPEGDPLARQTPGWIAGFASGGEIALFPARTPSYPHDSMEELLQHEVAHILIARAAGGRQVPRWFHEGVALAAERTWTLGDSTRFAIDVAFGGPVPASSLDRLFKGGLGSVDRAYRLSGLMVDDLLQAHGPDLAARVLAAMRGGRTFDEAFHTCAGVSVDEASRAFWHRRRLWVAWLPWLTSPGVLWTLVTLLALAAIARARWRRATRRWEDGPGGGGADGPESA